MKQTDPQYKLRLPNELKDRVESAAKESGRSMNAEIVSRLEASFADAEPPAGPTLEILKLGKKQKESFQMSIKRTIDLEQGASPEHLRLLSSMLAAAQEELATIDQQIGIIAGAMRKG